MDEVLKERNSFCAEVDRLEQEAQTAWTVAFEKGRVAARAEVEQLEKKLEKRDFELKTAMLSSSEQSVEVSRAHHEMFWMRVSMFHDSY